ncbi:serine--tRNA ligase [Candidatus Woesearchaeota archaeon]|nr:serine--tRNA ligase [Candidatus Woesearchaeota archaeon]
MLDMKFIRENPDIIKRDLDKRGDIEKKAWVDEVIEKDKQYRQLLQKAEELRASRNSITTEINELRKAGKDITDKLSEAKAIPDKIKEIEEKKDKLSQVIKARRMAIPNILHESVPVGHDDTENEVLREVGEKPKFDFEMVPHGEWLEQHNQADFKRAAKTSGAGFYFLKNDIAMLDFALQKFAIDRISQKGYSIIYPPYMIKREPYEGVTDLADFENVMYKIDGEDVYLIATSEHAIGAMHMNEIFDTSDMPLKYAGISACFRREIGSHGIDTKGIFRVHQFNKIEQFIFCMPEDSWKLHEELLANAEGLFQELKIPYRVVNICTGDIGSIAAKKYDIEAWMPRENKYREVVSCSNCTDYQAVRLNLRYRKGEDKGYLHTLNSTAIATSRAIRAIIENFQQKDGSVKIPEALLPYMNGLTEIR